MPTQKNVTLEPELFERVSKEAAAEGKTTDEIANEATKRYLARRAFDRFSRDAEKRRGSMTDEQVEAVVNKAVQESRNERRGR